MTRRITITHGADGERGASTASFVILFPLFLFMFMGLVQWGLYFHARSQVAAAAQDAARAAQGQRAGDVATRTATERPAFRRVAVAGAAA
ncbi:MAG: TadE family protein, partial [Micromonosporaceae bacterium]